MLNSRKIEQLVKLGHIRIDTYTPSNTGGISCGGSKPHVKVTHIPTGDTVTCAHHRSQHKNKEVALDLLTLMMES